MKVNCRQCEIEFNKCPSAIANTKNNFCSLSCAAKYNNVNKPKRSLGGQCYTCKEPIHSKLKYCKACYSSRVITRPSKYKTLGDVVKNDLAKYSQITSNCLSIIRNAARVIAYRQKDKRCQACGYDKFTEVCHIKAISDFDLDTELTIINDIYNLAVLCPNCHKELDRGILKLE